MQDYSALNILVVGAGKIASGYDDPNSGLVLSHAHAAKKSPKYNLVGFVDSVYQKAEIASQKWGGKPYHSMFDVDETVDVICCAVPDEYHYSIARDAIGLAPKALILEKPVVTEASDGYELKTLLLEQGIKAEVNYSRRFMSAFGKLKLSIASMGQLLTGTVFYCRGFLHNASHMINLFLLLFDQITPIFEMDGMADFSEDDHNKTVLFDVDGGTVAFLPVDSSTVTTFEFDLLFEKGRVKYDDAECSIRYYKKRESSLYKGEINYEYHLSEKINTGEALENLYNNVWNMINNYVSPVSSIDDAIRTIELCMGD